MNEEQLIEIANQLRHPSGESGIKIGDVMHESNIAMTIAAIDSLNLKENDNILEIGHGNCAHLKVILEKANDINYFGLDISELMHKTAINLNAESIDNNKAKFILYTGESFPFDYGYFDKIMTVNTIYFWENPEYFLTEIWRILKNNGTVSIVFGLKNYMEKLPFTKYGFKLYSNRTFKKLIKYSGFVIKTNKTYKDNIISKEGKPIERMFSAITLEKYTENSKSEYGFTPKSKKKRGLRRYFKNISKINIIDEIKLPFDQSSSFDFLHLHIDNSYQGNISFKRRKPHLDALISNFKLIVSKQNNDFLSFQCWLELNEFDSYDDRIYLHTKNHNNSKFPCYYSHLKEQSNFINLDIIQYINSLEGFNIYYGEITTESHHIRPIVKRFCILYKPDFGIEPFKLQ